MTKYILAHDFYVEGVGHFKKSRGLHDWRDLPSDVKPPKSATKYGGSAEKPIESKGPPLPGIGRTQTVEEILAQRLAAGGPPKVEEPHDPAKSQAPAGEEQKPEAEKPVVEADDLRARLASRDTTQGRAGGKR